MTIYIRLYVDESGSFDEGLTGRRPALVGGVCSTHNEEQWKTLHLQRLEAYNQNARIQLAYPDQYHCGEFLAGKLDPAGKMLAVHEREDFVDDVLKSIGENSTFIFACLNRGSRFEYSPQATYGINLIAALRAALDKLAGTGAAIEAVEICVAQRTTIETMDLHYENYHKRLLHFVEEQISCGDSPGSKLARNLLNEKKMALLYDIGSRNAGLIAADFVCCMWRRSGERCALATSCPQVMTKPAAMLFGDHRRFYDREALDLIQRKQYAYAADFLRRFLPNPGGTPDLGPLKIALQKESDPAVLQRELPAMLALARYLIDQRTEEPSALDAAQVMLEEIDQMAKKRISQTDNKNLIRAWADVQVEALDELIACHNHRGRTDAQTALEDQLQQILSQHARVLSKTYHARRDLLLEARTRNLNILFNDYRFAEVLDTFEAEVQVREREIPEGETDELLGKMLGSLGQACAFLARCEPSWSEMARDYFEKSLRHFAAGTIYHAMAVNYLATLAWQEGNLDLACREMHGHPAIPKTATALELVAKLPVYTDNEKASAFDVVNCLRVAALLALQQPSAISSAVVAEIGEFWRPRLLDEHPLEHICKWMGLLWMCAGDCQQADTFLQRGVDICRKLEFTVRTIGLSIQGLAIINLKKNDNQGAAATQLAVFKGDAEHLACQSQSFAKYLTHWGGIAGLLDMIAKEDVRGMATFLPFAYA